MTVAAAPSLAKFDQQLRGYQRDAVGLALRICRGELMDDATGKRLDRALLVAPTGTGKGAIELALLRDLRAAGLDALLITPSLEIARGFLERCGATTDDLSCGEDRLAAMAEAIGVVTPVRYRNAVLQGARPSADVFIADEAHHYTDGVETYSLLFTLAPEAKWIGLTATGFRGTPRGTRELREAWGEPWVILTVPEAAAAGYCCVPEVQVVPLIDDDRIEVRNGQFVVSACDSAAADRVSELASLAQAEAARAPTVVVMPSTDTARQLAALAGGSLPFTFVGQHSKATDRAAAIEATRAGRAILVVVALLGEGVDFPWLRTLVDASPTLSPVVWAQRVGRVMRPGEVPARYLACCRNLERHAYLLQGALPLSCVAQAQNVFGEPSDRGVTRAFGLEALKRFKQIQVPAAAGVRAGMWVVGSVSGDGVMTEYVAILHPTRPDPICAMRVNGVDPTNGERKWGRFTRCEPPADLAGFATTPFRNTCSEAQKRWWRNAARAFGLDAEAADTLTARQFYALPVLTQLKERLL